MKKILNSQQAGFSTLEMMIAFLILILTLTTVILVAFGNQATSTSSQTSHEALYRAQQILEDARASSSHGNFPSIIAITSASISTNIYTKETKVVDIDPACKRVTSLVRWQEGNRSLSTNLTTLLTDPIEAQSLSAGVCSMLGPNDFKIPQSFGGGVSAPGTGTSIDVYNKTVFLGAVHSDPTRKDFYVVDASNSSNIQLKYSINTGYGINALDAVVIGSDYYIFAALASTTSQFQVIRGPIDFSSSPVVIANRKLPGVTGSCPSTCPEGRSIFYYNQKIYIGTHRLTAGGAAEFHVYDVVTPTNPIWLGSKGGVSLGDAVDHNINKIWTRDQTVGGITYTYAYLATSADSKEVMVLNVTNPASIPDPAGTPATGSNFNLGAASVNDLDAYSLYVIGDRAYVGRDRATGINNDFYILNIAHPEALTGLGSAKLGLSNNTYISGVRATSNLALISTTDPNEPFVVYDVSIPATPVKYNTNNCNFSTYAADLAYEYPNTYIAVGNSETFILIDPNNGNSQCK